MTACIDLKKYRFQLNYRNYNGIWQWCIEKQGVAKGVWKAAEIKTNKETKAAEIETTKAWKSDFSIKGTTSTAEKKGSRWSKLPEEKFGSWNSKTKKWGSVVRRAKKTEMQDRLKKLLIDRKELHDMGVPESEIDCCYL